MLEQLRGLHQNLVPLNQYYLCCVSSVVTQANLVDETQPGTLC